MKGYQLSEKWLRALRPNTGRKIYGTLFVFGECAYYTDTIQQIVDLLEKLDSDKQVTVELHADFSIRVKFDLKIVDSAYYKGDVSREPGTPRPLHVSPRGRLYHLMPCPISTRYCYRYWVE